VRLEAVGIICVHYILVLSSRCRREDESCRWGSDDGVRLGALREIFLEAFRNMELIKHDCVSVSVNTQDVQR
jgi:hypothetical protein